MLAHAGTILIATLGLAVLTALTFGAQAQSQQVAVLIPPWHGDGLARVIDSRAAITDLRLGGHLVVLDTGGDRATLARLRGQGFWVMDATGSLFCTTTSGV